jgi:PadR family transcriptional regulator PadR
MKGVRLLIFQIGATLLDACVLSVVEKQDTYGYALTQTLRDWLGVSESTLYPVLRRLQKENCLSTYDVPHQGRNRRYYKITDVGSSMAVKYREAWKDYRGRLDGLILGGGQVG